jgi:hypothetical protein
MPLVLSGTDGISTNGSTWALQPNASGHTRKPSTPAFFATGPTSYQSVAAGGKLTHFTTAVYNQGGHYNTGNQRFTAPIAGLYQFNFHSLRDGNGDGSVSFYVNGLERTRCYNSNSRARNLVATLLLNQNDYVEVYVQDTAMSLYGSPYGGFSGFYIG